MLGLLGAQATSPMETVPSRSKRASNVVPAFVVLNRPPKALAMYHIVGSFSQMAMSTTRPPMAVGPIVRQRNALAQAGSSACPVIVEAEPVTGGVLSDAGGWAAAAAVLAALDAGV